MKKTVPGTPFKKGNKFGKGRPPLSPEQKKINASLKKVEGKLLLAKYCLLDFKEIQKLTTKFNSPKVRVIDLFIARLLEKGISRGDVQIMTWVFETLGWNEVEQKSNVPVILNFSKDDANL